MSTKQSLDFLKSFEKELDAMEGGISTSAEPPRYWYSTGNYVLNRIMSGSYNKGIPQGRVTNLAGPSGAGKSFISANIAAAAQRAGAYVLVVDSEGALDDNFMSKIGVDVGDNYKYVSVTTIPDVTKVVSSFINKYREQVGSDPDAPQVFILIDSLDMLMTETEVEHYEKGVSKGDQGQKNKQLKALLRTFVQSIKTLNIAIVCTSQVYKNQDILNGEGVWIVSDAVKYAASQIILVQKRKLKDDSKGAKAGDVAGVRMVCEGYKTRFTKPFQRVEIEVPYDTGMDPASGLVEVAVIAGVVVKRGSRYALANEEEAWYSKDIGPRINRIVDQLEQQTNAFLQTDAETDTSASPSAKSQRIDKYNNTSITDGVIS